MSFEGPRDQTPDFGFGDDPEPTRQFDFGDDALPPRRGPRSRAAKKREKAEQTAARKAARGAKASGRGGRNGAARSSRTADTSTHTDGPADTQVRQPDYGPASYGATDAYDAPASARGADRYGASGSDTRASGTARGSDTRGASTHRRAASTDSDFDFGPDGPDDLPPRGRSFGGKARRPAWQRIAMALGAVVLVVLLAAGAVGATYSGKALPGTKVGGEDVGGQTEAELRNTVRRLASPTRLVNLIAPDGTLRVSAQGGGLRPDVDATVQRALDSRRGTFLTPLASFVRGANIPLEADVDESRLTASVKRIASTVDRKPYAGALSIDPDSLTVTSKASKAGREVEQEQLRTRLRAALLRPSAGSIKVPVESTKAVSQSGVDDVAKDAEQYLRASLSMTGAGKPYAVKPADLAKLLALEPFDGGRDARLGVDSAELSRLTAKVAAARNRSAKSATISAPARGPVLDGKAEVSWSPKPAKVTVASEGRSGLAVKVKDLNSRVRSAVRKGEHSLKVPTSTTSAPVSRASARKIDRVIGTFTTAYVAGQPRVTNIQRIAKAIDRTVIAPGQQFSMNGIAGERTKAKGYVEAPFIAGNKIEPSIGGGVSQFSTTMYNAAYFAGLRIDAHQAHSLYIDRYPPGRESTLNFPDIDMRWTNDTDVPILIRAYADSAGVTVTLYGDNGGRSVTAQPGAREPNPGGDFSITVTRRIKYRDGRVVEQPSTTKYATEVVEDTPQE